MIMKVSKFNLILIIEINSVILNFIVTLSKYITLLLWYFVTLDLCNYVIILLGKNFILLCYSNSFVYLSCCVTVSHITCNAYIVFPNGYRNTELECYKSKLKSKLSSNPNSKLKP